MTSFIPSFLEMNRNITEATGKPFRVRRPTVQLHPKGAERSFGADVAEILDLVQADIEEQLLPEIDRLSRVSQLRGDEYHADIEDISAIIDTIVGQLTVRLDNRHLRDLELMVRGYFNDTSNFSRTQTLRQIKRMLGVDAFPREPQLQVMLNSFVQENIADITSLTRGHVNAMANIVRRRVRAGDRPAVIAEDIRERFKTTRNKAKLLARDQVNKLNGSLTRMRQTGLGIDEYIWRTSRDERVRSKHLAREGVKFRWDDPPDGGHPGQEVLCRCQPEPVIEGAPPKRENRREVIREVKRKRKALRAKLEGKKGKVAARARRLIAR